MTFFANPSGFNLSTTKPPHRMSKILCCFRSRLMNNARSESSLQAGTGRSDRSSRTLETTPEAIVLRFHGTAIQRHVIVNKSNLLTLPIWQTAVESSQADILSVTDI
ncbi:hypothetical protein Ciccas_003288 [Cichlidogyrus casuarinus]|uniref:Uncharacterized protein n=1 Tax=Cichlidogyrus casuarinus TaxID=1844966 RepID=A0ABD2QH37_9PLAT